MVRSSYCQSYGRFVSDALVHRALLFSNAFRVRILAHGRTHFWKSVVFDNDVFAGRKRDQRFEKLGGAIGQVGSPTITGCYLNKQVVAYLAFKPYDLKHSLGSEGPKRSQCFDDGNATKSIRPDRCLDFTER